MNSKVKEVLTSVLDKFKSGDIPEIVSYAMYPIADVPSSSWSLMNRTLMLLSETRDARGYRQWQQANRFVKKGAKALYILVPFMKKSEGDHGKEMTVLKGFGCKPVFKVEDTDGDPLDYQEIELPEFPLLERAEQWGISVQAVPGNCHFFGCYSGKRQEIELATQEECIFFTSWLMPPMPRLWVASNPVRARYRRSSWRWQVTACADWWAKAESGIWGMPIVTSNGMPNKSR